ncbi:hypothetical protein J2X31_000982 [Flavobacterium arsenatis]|uniref:T9SS type B sorting domain-containing protein n=1 Tax=Flavobacterium arsenatis TaxID=1484332 RepID=A0ABU1TNH3_9FLAO|nr:GEVED domain-containing protein [Flavobacterium arsenatis]MDR6966982.1 hypothetical protein [Flavobacterium arsenatis]
MDLNYNSRGSGYRILPEQICRGMSSSMPVKGIRKFSSWPKSQLLSVLTLILMLSSSEFYAQQVSTYLFAESTETYVPVGGTLSTATGDDGTQSTISIGFDFKLGVTTYTTFSITTNGMIRLGNTIVDTGWTNSLGNTTTLRPLVAPFWDDNNATGGTVNYELTGVAPNRVLSVGWNSINIGGGGATSATNKASFKLRLYETTNIVEFVYGPIMAAAGTLSASVGLNDSSSFLSITPAAPSTASGTTANNGISATTNLVGKKFTFTPPPVCEGTPEAGIAMPLLTNVCVGVAPVARIVTGSTTGASGLTYQWEESINGVDFVNAVGGTGATTMSYTPPVFAGTDIQYRLKVTCSESGLFDYSEVSEVKGPIIPQTLPTNLQKIENLAGAVTLSWANGNGTRRYVVINTVNEFTAPSTADVTGVSTAYTSGEKIVYDGTGSNVTVTGLTPGNYFVKIYEYVRCTGTPNVNYYNVDFTPATLVVEGATNGSCANAIQLDLSNPAVTSKVGSTVGAVVGTDYLNCAALGSQTTERGAWYRFMGNNQQITFLTCHPTIGFDSRLSVYSGGCSNFTCVAVNDDAAPACVGANQFSSKVTFNALTGVEYYVFVHGYQTGTDLSATGNFVLTWEMQDLCSPVTANDECSTAEILTIGTSTASSNECATQSFGVASPSAGSALGTYFDAWYKFNSGNVAATRISLAYEAPVEVGFSVYQNACGSLTQITGGSNLTGSQMNLTGLIPNTDYYIRVYASQTIKKGDYTINLFEICSLPTAITSLVESQTGATVSWVNSVSTTLGSYSYELRTSGAAGSGATGLVAEGSVNANNISFDSLIASTTYSFYIKSVCTSSTDASAWSSATTFFTGYCVPSSTLTTTFINNFSTVGAISNVSNLASGYATAGYQDNYATQEMIHHAGGSFSFTANVTGGPVGLNVWVDWNNNFVFEASEKLYGTTTTTSAAITQTVAIPADVALGSYRMRVLTANGVANPLACSTTTRTEAEDYKFTIVAQPEESITWANIQAFVVDGVAVGTMQPCQTVDVYTQAWDSIATEPAGENMNLQVWIGMNPENTDPATWPEAAFQLATYNIQVGNNDEYKVTYNGLPVGDHYFASRYKLGFGPYKYGVTNGLWNGTDNNAALLNVAIPAINLSPSEASFCEVAEPVTITITSANPNYTYTFDGVASTGSEIVTPVATTTYTVVGTDSVTGCSTTSTMVITINNNPTAATIDFTDASMCVGSIQELSVNGGLVSKTLVSGAGTFTSTPGSGTPLGPNPFQNYYGGTKQQWIYQAQELLDLGFTSQATIENIALNMVATNGVALQNVVVKMKNTVKQEFEATGTVFETDLTVVRNAANHTPTVGQNVLSLDTPFVWDGVSNLVVEVNYSNNNAGPSPSNTAKYSATTHRSTFMWRADNQTAAVLNANLASMLPANTGSYTSFLSRTDVVFNVGVQAAVTWSPATDLYSDAMATVPYVLGTPANVVYTKPTSAVSYVATVTTDTNCIITTASQEFTLLSTVALPTVPGGSSGGGVSNLIISEYGEGAGGNKKYIELYNGTGAAVDLANFRLVRSSNGGGWVVGTLALTGTLANNNTYTIANNSTDVLGADLYNSGFIQFNGDDAIGLEWNGGSGTVFSLIDVFGQHDSDPGTGWTVAGIANATVDKILTRKSSVCGGNTSWAASSGTDEATSEWTVSSFTYNDVAQTATTLGSHTANCGTSQPGALEVCPTATVAAILSEVTGTDVQLYDAATGGVALSETANLVEGSYYASQTVGGCESARAEIAVTFSEVEQPNFAAIGTICEGSVAPTLATTSPNGIEGTWSPALIDNMASGTYVFTPNAGVCAATQTLAVTVSSTPIAPDFASALTLCSTADMPLLAATSPNGIIGVWSPAVVDSSESGTYTFTPNAGQCGSVHQLVVTINDEVTPNFPAIAICSGATAPVLELTSPNGVTGTWNPAVIDNMASGDYVFTPDAGQCAVAQILSVTVNEMVVPDFASIAPICSGDTAPVLETTSPNGITGTWIPATVSNTASGDYTFSPDAGQCAVPISISVTVNELPLLVINNPAAVCSSETVDITADAVTTGSGNDLTLTYWADPFGNVSFPGPDAIPSSGTFYIKAENANGCSVISPVSVVVKDAVDAPTTTTPTQDFTTGDDLTDFEVTGTDLIWYDASTDGNVIPSSTLITTGTVYYVSQTVDGCESEGRLMITAGVDLRTPGFDSASLKYYPNPVSDVLTVTYSSAIESIEIFNVLGQKVYKKAHNSQEVKIDMSSLATGNYIINVMANGLIKNIKVIKK